MEAEHRDGVPLTVPLMHDGNDSNSDQNTVSSTSFCRTCFNGLNALSGLLIQRCMDMDSDIRTYPDIGNRAFGNKGRLLVSVAMYMELFMVATGFLILEGDNLYNLFPDAGFEVVGISIGGKKMFIIIVALLILPSVWLDNLSLLSYISAGGVFASAIILFSILWTGAFDGIGFHEKGILLNLDGLPTTLSLYGFCYCAHPVFPTLYTSMRNKRQFPNVLLVCFTLCTITYASMAVIGYLMFGISVQSQITLNFPTNKFSARVAIYTTLVLPIAKYGVMVTPIVNAVKSRFSSPSNKKIFGLLISSLFVFGTTIVALVVRFFAYLMSLVGAFLSVTGSIILAMLMLLEDFGYL